MSRWSTTGLLRSGLLAVLASSAVAGEITFSEQTIDASLNGATGVAVADLDGDGDNDVLAAGLLADDVVWYENTSGTADSWTRRFVDSSFAGAAAVAVGDIDGDDDLDVVAVASSADYVT